jgi:dipeptidyl aminopeptidase/acylaminoacyl peptidase
MARVIRRAVGAGMLATLLLAASAAMAAAPAGPRLAVVKLSAKPPRFELVTVNRNGGKPVRLAGGGRRARPVLDFFSPISWSADGERLGFSGIVGFREDDDQEPIRKIFTVGAGGGDPRPVPGTKGAVAPVFSPDGRTVAVTRAIDRETPTTVGGVRRETGFHGASIWIVDLLTGAQRQLTPWQDQVRYSASSFSPDGSTLLATHEDELHLNEPEPVALRTDGSGSKRLLDDGSSPVFSPDGSRVALIRRTEEYGENRGEDTDLYVIDADGTDVRRITRTPGRLELSPSWDPSGERLAYVRLPESRSEEAPFGYRIALMEVNADGTCQRAVVSRARTYFFTPAWQPGADRGAGRIECRRGRS